MNSLAMVILLIIDDGNSINIKLEMIERLCRSELNSRSINLEEEK